ncbi:MAG: DUF2625 family protein [Mucilaginibacter sp.]
MKTTRLILSAFITCVINIASAQNVMRPIEELTKDVSGWEVVENAMRIARNKFKILPKNSERATEALYQTQVTTHSAMGAVIYLTGGILIEDGWIRILGSGSAELNRSLPGWNKDKTYSKAGEKPGYLLIGDDVVGGFFAINGGSLGNEMGMVYYLAPDDLKWESLHISYTDFINFCFCGDMKLFYGDLGWPECRNDVNKVSGTDSFFFYPYRWTKEGKYISKDKRTIVPVEEIYTLETSEIKVLSK